VCVCVPYIYIYIYVWLVFINFAFYKRLVCLVIFLFKVLLCLNFVWIFGVPLFMAENLYVCMLDFSFGDH
jgi:hypothetical protein